jgi:endonuclease YncB( thermonuclease family)
MATLDSKKTRVRIKGIDAPELNQPYGIRAREELKKLISGQKILLTEITTDHYDRVLARPMLINTNLTENEKDIALILISKGAAWSDHETSHIKQMYRNAQQKAQSSKLGLWGNANPESPHNYRMSTKN